MPRRSKPKETKRDWRWWANVFLNGAVVVSMVFGSILVFTGLTPRQAVPTIEAPTVAPTPSTPAPTPTPKAHFDLDTPVWMDGLVRYSLQDDVL